MWRGTGDISINDRRGFSKVECHPKLTPALYADTVAQSARVAVIGGGILGLAHACIAARRGHAVFLFERGSTATGASIRNFGMIWPIGQPAGEMRQIALRSREIWLEVLETARLPHRDTGSLHVAYRDDEADVLREFAEIAPCAGYDCEWLPAPEVLERSEAIQPRDLKGGLWSATELTVDPRLVVARLPEYLREIGVSIHFGHAVTRVALPRIETSAGCHEADVAIICSGDDFETLFPGVLSASGLTRCKLQMMRTAPQPGGWQLGPAVAAGLTLRFYKAFQICSTLPALRERIVREKPEYERYLIHVLVSQTADGAITLGDSHEYGPCLDIFDKAEIDELILREARTFLQIPDFEIAQRWHGVYSTHPEKPFFEAEPATGVRIVTAPGGSGMTLSFGLAERTLDQMGL
jgi:FAD dependent oxidoreductase TIGR03364